MENNAGFYFTSSLFSIEPGEDKKTNPNCYGLQLARWLHDQLRLRAIPSRLIAEDWGWAVMADQEFYMRLFGCANMAGPVEHKPHDQIVWHAFAQVDVFFWNTWFRKTNTAQVQEEWIKLLKDILTHPDIHMID